MQRPRGHGGSVVCPTDQSAALTPRPAAPSQPQPHRTSRLGNKIEPALNRPATVCHPRAGAGGQGRNRAAHARAVTRHTPVPCVCRARHVAHATARHTPVPSRLPWSGTGAGSMQRIAGAVAPRVETLTGRTPMEGGASQVRSDPDIPGRRRGAGPGRALLLLAPAPSRDPGTPGPDPRPAHRSQEGPARAGSAETLRRFGRRAAREAFPAAAGGPAGRTSGAAGADPPLGQLGCRADLMENVV